MSSNGRLTTPPSLTVVQTGDDNDTNNNAIPALPPPLLEPPTVEVPAGRTIKHPCAVSSSGDDDKKVFATVPNVVTVTSQPTTPTPTGARSRARQHSLPALSRKDARGSAVTFDSASKDGLFTPSNVDSGFDQQHRHIHNTNNSSTGDVSCASGKGSRGGNSSIEDSLGGTDHGSATSGGRSRVSSNGGSSSHFEVCGRKIKIPFTVWTFLAMAVPVTMLLITTIIPMVEASADLDRVSRYRALAQDVSDCITAAVNEDYALHRVAYLPSAASERTYAAAMLAMNSVCDDVLLADLLRIARTNGHFEAPRDELQDALRQLFVRRALVRRHLDAEGSNITLALHDELGEMQITVARVVVLSTNTLARASAVIESMTSRYFMDLKLIGEARAKLWFAASTGNAFLSASDGGSRHETVAFAKALGAAETALDNIEGATSPDVAGLAFNWRHENETATMLANLRRVVRMGSVTSAFDVRDSAEFTAQIEPGIRRLQDVEAVVVRWIADATASKDRVLRNGVLLGIGVLVSLTAAALLARQQLKVQKVLQSQVRSVERTRQAVSAFVPRFFLNKMGYTSITQVCIGDSAEVALTMLFADIRQFTTVAEEMTSRALFNWVQGYFRLMTTIIEGHHGNINQFIGDALFALFSTAKDGVTCAVDMQAKTQQLNLERLCLQGNTTPLDIGVGLHHDVLSLGILGDARRHTCTAISASVNLASRLEGLTKQLGCRIVASEAAVEQLGPLAGGDVPGAVALRRIGPAQVKGSGEPVPIYDVFQADERALQALKQETTAVFAEYARLALADASTRSTERLEALQHELDAAADRHGVTDGVVQTLGAAASAQARVLVFDTK